MATRVELPDKLFFKIGEVTAIVGVKQHVLRYWESEFPSIRPQKSKTNQRLYRRKDVEAILAIKHLLYDKKFTIEGARIHLKDQGVESSLPPEDPKALAAAARQKAISEMQEQVATVKKQTVDHYERRLLELKNEIAAFISSFDEEYQ